MGFLRGSATSIDVRLERTRRGGRGGLVRSFDADDFAVFDADLDPEIAGALEPHPDPIGSLVFQLAVEPGCRCHALEAQRDAVPVHDDRTAGRRVRLRERCRRGRDGRRGVVAGVVVGGDVGGATVVSPGAAGALVDGAVVADAVVDDAVPVGGITDGTVVVGSTDVLEGAVVTIIR